MTPGVSKKEVRLIPSGGAQIKPHRWPGTRKGAEKIKVDGAVLRICID